MVAEQNGRDPGLVSREEMEHVVRRRLRSSNFTLLEYSALTGQSASQGFLGIHLTVRATVRFQGQELHLNFFAKAIPTEEKFREIVDGTMGFVKEDEFYNILYDPLTKAWENGLLTREADPSEEPEPHWGPVCFLCSPRLVVMQDLTKFGFKAIPSWNEQGVDFATITLMLRAIAGLHSSSVVVQHAQKLDPVKAAPSIDKESFLSSDPTALGRHIFVTGERALAEGILPLILEKLPFTEAKRSEEQQRLRDVLHDLMAHLSINDIRARAAAAGCNLQVISHGDCWPSNIMMRYSEDGVPLRCVLVDFQLTRMAPVAWDVLMCLTLACRRSFRKQHMDVLLKGYYADLAKFTRQRGVDLGPIMSEDDFLESTRRIMPLARMITCIYLSVCNAPKEDIAQVVMDANTYKQFMMVDRTKTSSEWFKKDAKYRDRVGEILCETLGLETPDWST